MRATTERRRWPWDVFSSAPASSRAQTSATVAPRCSTGPMSDARGCIAWRCERRRERRFAEAADYWREIVARDLIAGGEANAQLAALREFAVEALAIHHEHRERDLQTARELAVFALEELEGSRRGTGADAAKAIATASRGSSESWPKSKTLSSCGAERSISPSSRNGLCLGGDGLLLGLRGRLAALGGLSAEPLGETLDAAFRVDQLLPSGKERVAVVADLEVQLLLGRAGVQLAPQAQRATTS